MKSNMTKHEHQLENFKSAIVKGVAESKAIILKTSANCAKNVKDSPVGNLAVNVDDTIKVFVKDDSDGTLLRFNLLATPLIDIVVTERSKTFSKIDDHKKLNKLGLAFGVMIGTAALTSVIKIFVNQAVSKLNENQEISNEEKRTCLSYINDVFSIILMTLSSSMESDYNISKRERAFFAELLWKNDWKTIFKDSPILTNAEELQQPTEEEHKTEEAP
jgi:hypothetical protein